MNNFSLVVRNIKNLNEFQKLSDSVKELDLERYVFDVGAYYSKEKEAIFSCWESQEWREYNGQMIVLSEKHPKMTFELTIQHEDTFWRIYYKDGSTETCNGEVIFEQPVKIKWDELLAF